MKKKQTKSKNAKPSPEKAVKTLKIAAPKKTKPKKAALEIPEDLQEALLENARAKGHWDKFPLKSKKLIIAYIEKAPDFMKRIERVREAVSSAAMDIRVNHYNF